MEPERLFVFAATFEDVPEAKNVVRQLRLLQDDHRVEKYDSAIIQTEAGGAVRIEKMDALANHGMAYGLLAAALVGLLFPPILLEEPLASELAIDVMGTGTVMERVRQGVGRSELAALGRILANSPAALLVIGDSNFRDVLAPHLGAAVATIQKEVVMGAAEAGE